MREAIRKAYSDVTVEEPITAKKAEILQASSPKPKIDLNEERPLFKSSQTVNVCCPYKHVMTQVKYSMQNGNKVRCSDCRWILSGEFSYHCKPDEEHHPAGLNYCQSCAIKHATNQAFDVQEAAMGEEIEL